MKSINLSLTKLLIIGLLLAIFSSKSYAAEEFYGLKGNTYVGIDYLYSRAENRHVGPASSFSPQDPKVSNDRSGYGLNLGYKIAKGNVFIAPEIFHERLDNEVRDFYNYSDSATVIGDKLKIRSRNGAKVALGYKFFDKASVFASYGLASVEYFQSFPSVNRHYRSRQTGNIFGFGASYEVYKDLEVRLAYDIQRIDADYDPEGSVNHVNRIKLKVAKIGLVYNF
jgi:opacity protein-like surface antigen